MKTFEFYDNIFVRTPSYPINFYSEDKLRSLLEHEYFLVSILFSSSSLYFELQKSKFNLDEMPLKVKTSLWKYFNRMCFRATPFGTMSSFGMSKWISKTTNIEISNERVISIQPDFYELYKELQKRDKDLQVSYIANPTIYKFNDELRYFYFDPLDQEYGSLISFPTSSILVQLLGFTKELKTLQSINDFLKSLKLNTKTADFLITKLIDQQVLFPESYLNALGKNYCSRILEINHNVDIHLKIKHFKIDSITNKAHQIESYLETKETAKNLYVNTYSTYSGGVSDIVKNKLSEVLELIKNIFYQQESIYLKKIKSKMKKNYELEFIPFCELIDPESGIISSDYLQNGFEEKKIENKNEKTDFTSQEITWSKFHEYLLNKWLKNKELNILKISKNEIYNLSFTENEIIKHPPGLFIIFKISPSNQIWIENIGGTSGQSLMGRFTHFDLDIENYSKEIVKKEQKINSNVLFVDVNFIPNDKAINIHSRRSIYDYEISLAPHLGQAYSKSIPLNDLYVGVKDDFVYLWSNNLKKYIIPRLSSAYNMSLSGHPAYRFFCELHFQAIKSGYFESFDKIIPGLDFYPRIEIEDVVMSAALWIINKNEIELIKKDINVFWKIKQERNIPDIFSVVEADRYIVINVKNEIDLELFYSSLTNRNEVKLQEYYLNNIHFTSTIYTHQYVASAYSNKASYSSKDFPLVNLKLDTYIKRTFYPGTSWLFFKIYTNDINFNQILIELFSANDLSKELKKMIKKWFFVRYRDPEEHLRIRFDVLPNKLQDVIAVFNKIMQKFLEKKIIKTIQIDTYKRELERYPEGTISVIEEIFHCTSSIALRLIKESMDYRILIQLISSIIMIDVFIKDKNELSEFLKKFHPNIKEFMKVNDINSNSLNTFLRDLLTKYNLRDINNQKMIKKYRNLILSLSNQIDQLQTNKKQELITDIIHMNANKIFSKEIHKNEILNYHYLYIFFQYNKSSMTF